MAASGSNSEQHHSSAGLPLEKMYTGVTETTRRICGRLRDFCWALAATLLCGF
jgi:hypothetical protein